MDKKHEFAEAFLEAYTVFMAISLVPQEGYEILEHKDFKAHGQAVLDIFPVEARLPLMKLATLYQADFCHASIDIF